MSSDLEQAAAALPLQVAAPLAAPPLVDRLVNAHGAQWLDSDGVAAWAAGGGDRVIFLAGDPVRFPEALDVAVVLPELLARFPQRFRIGVARREHEDAIARRYGSTRWPALVFVRDGGYVTTLSGMLDWDVFVERVAAALDMPTSRPPITLRNGNADATCH